MPTIESRSQIGVMLPFRRAHESEADQVDLTYMAKAGYVPAEAVLFWQRFPEPVVKLELFVPA